MSLPTIPLRRTTANGPHMGSQISFKTPDWHRTLEDIQTHLTPHRVLYLVLLASALALALALGPLRRRPTHPPQIRLPESPRALAALQRLLVPARSRWPEPYTALAARADARAPHTLSIPLALLLRDLLAGTVELRHPAQSLHALFAGAEPGARGNDDDGGGGARCVRVRVVADVGLWARVLARLARERVFPAPFDLDAFLGAHLRYSLAAHADDEDEDDQHRPHSPPPPLAPRASFTLDLDAVPPTELESLLHHLHAALPTNPRTTLTLGLTTLGAHLSPLTLDPSFVLAAVPFLPPPPPPPPPPVPPPPQHQPQQHSARSSLALTASLPRVLSRLQQARFALLSATHVSSARAAALLRTQAAAAARTPPDARARVLAAWEAALLEDGLLRRWEIVVQKRG